MIRKGTCGRCGYKDGGIAHVCDPDSKLMFIDDKGEEHDMCDPVSLLDEIEELKTQLGFMKLKEKLHLRLIAAGNDGLAERGERITFLEEQLAYWAKEARGGFGED